MMDDKTYIFTFAFKPQKLSQAREYIERKYEDLDRLTASQLSALRLPKLLELIRQTPEEEIEQLSKTLKKETLWFLYMSIPTIRNPIAFRKNKSSLIS